MVLTALQRLLSCMRLSRRKHASKQTTRKMENKHRKVLIEQAIKLSDV